MWNLEMRTDLAALFVATFFFLVLSSGMSVTRAMPFQQLQASALIPIASGCGLGVRRGPFDRCDPIYYVGYGSPYRNAYYIGPVTGGVCGGRGTHLACNSYGICWAACN
jgi:hypothetical protein